MEEQILKMIDKMEHPQGYRYIPLAERQMILAKEITSHVMKFIKWVDQMGITQNDIYEKRKWDKEKKGYYSIYKNIKNDKEITIEQVYTYWLENINEK
jgi:hypothetical protein